MVALAAGTFAKIAGPNPPHYTPNAPVGVSVSNGTNRRHVHDAMDVNQ